MSLHQVSGNRRLGLGLAFVTMSVWAVLPLILQVLLGSLDPVSITWWRFMIAISCLAVLLWYRSELPALSRLGRREWLLLLVATLGLAGNYVLFLVALDLTSPATTQVLIQLGPLFLAVGGIVIFRERVMPRQWAGFALLLLGLLIFSGSQVWSLAFALDRYASGVVTVSFAALTWAIYALAQKQLLMHIDSLGLMLCIFVGCALILTPWARPASVASLETIEWVALFLGGLATLFAYGCFASALAHVEASRVSAVIALVPLGTVTISVIAGRLAPELFTAEPLSPGSLLGACVVVAGSLLIALGAE
jgi:drug/metabolite transporter (DMT)-like permease